MLPRIKRNNNTFEQKGNNVYIFHPYIFLTNLHGWTWKTNNVLRWRIMCYIMCGHPLVMVAHTMATSWLETRVGRAYSATSATRRGSNKKLVMWLIYPEIYDTVVVTGEESSLLNIARRTRDKQLCLLNQVSPVKIC